MWRLGEIKRRLVIISPARPKWRARVTNLFEDDIELHQAGILLLYFLQYEIEASHIRVLTLNNLMGVWRTTFVFDSVTDTYKCFQLPSFECIRQGSFESPTDVRKVSSSGGKIVALAHQQCRSAGTRCESSPSYMAGCSQLASTFIGYDVDIFVCLGLEEAKRSLHQRVRHVGKVFELFKFGGVVQIAMEDLKGSAVDTLA